MSSHMRDIRDIENNDLYMSPRHILLQYMDRRSEMKDRDTSWDVWRVRIV